MYQTIIILVYTSLNTALLRSALLHHIPHQAYVYAPLPEVQSAIDYCPDLPGLAGAHYLSQDHMG